jgi:hypothetical protein
MEFTMPTKVKGKSHFDKDSIVSYVRLAPWTELKE